MRNIPKAFLDYRGYDIYFWSNEMSGDKLEPIHVHIVKGKRRKNATKVWITEDGVSLCNNNSKIPESDLNRLLKYLTYNRMDIVKTWEEYFKQ